ncbi:polyphenol oxidase family protein [Parenemella sanctibonifatiensis]|nr:polyphenol oxidase family protein [Parenemella sanctibonifatiensis]
MKPAEFWWRRDPGPTEGSGATAVRAHPDGELAGIGMAFTAAAGGLSSRYGELNLGHLDTEDPAVSAGNYRAVAEALDLPAVIITTSQVHGADVFVVDAEVAAAWSADGHLGSRAVAGRPLVEADAAVTDQPGVALAVRVADCLPVLLADEQARVIGTAHAGRPGLYAGVLPATVAAMRRLGAESIRAWIGPHVCGDCYEVPQDMHDDCAAKIPVTSSRTSWGTPALDLAAGARAQLADAGVVSVDVEGCTRTEPRLHSYRRDGARSGRLAGFVWMN